MCGGLFVSIRRLREYTATANDKNNTTDGRQKQRIRPNVPQSVMRQTYAKVRSIEGINSGKNTPPLVAVPSATSALVVAIGSFSTGERMRYGISVGGCLFAYVGYVSIQQ